MEYLMTYGWAILIVAVVLGALYSLGIFNGANFLGGACIAATGYLCSNPVLYTSGALAFTYGYQGPNVTIDGFACTNSTVAPSSFSSSGSSSIQPGQEESVSASCPVSSSDIGTSFSGYLWVEYNQNGQDNLIARFASVSTTVSSLPPMSGNVWVQTSAPIATWESIACSSDCEYIVAGVWNGGYVYTSSDYGSTWTQTSLPSGSWKALTMSSDGSHMVAANYAGSSSYVYTSSDYGATWSQTSAPSALWYDAACSSDCSTIVVAAATLANGIYVSKNYGSTWTQANVPTGSDTPQVACSSDCSTIVAALYNSGIYKSTDYGSTWTQTSAPTEWWSAVTCSSDCSHIFASISASTGYIYVSNNGGSTWSLTSAPGKNWRNVGCSTDCSRAVSPVGGGGIYKSTDYGSTWTRTSAPTRTWESIICSSDCSRIYAVAYGDGIWVSSS